LLEEEKPGWEPPGPRIARERNQKKRILGASGRKGVGSVFVRLGKGAPIPENETQLRKKANAEEEKRLGGPNIIGGRGD